mgnify:CR=1 FL=1
MVSPYDDSQIPEQPAWMRRSFGRTLLDVALTGGVIAAVIGGMQWAARQPMWLWVAATVTLVASLATVPALVRRRAQARLRPKPYTGKCMRCGWQMASSTAEAAIEVTKAHCKICPARQA